ncbi:methyl-accepting chemotaxis protein [Bradyrhizobium sp.]|uniref:methyl-accepting chemotaxis protein n=1 Tax=Bradyrhizobium sp. TaxID=376 RepID=UPI001DEE57DB|nr:methyl-accepting chemotaxis protein [Bradyrhizobium sp.]MBV8699465.1 methyl-accepting chemotaxis protein [Bradyrhizobium sp.]MBV8920561.1 methyl-accepting chemotaxis protein [Bradyrhizobium sp.]MBV9978685.1 methyl-accepting chemotaxis protein [Bradyrhizobium sp.]
MQFLGRFRILTKILAVVLLLAALMGSLAYLATSALNDQNQRAVRMAAAAKRSMLAARANVNVMSMIGAEFRSALDPRDDNRKAAGHVIDEQVRLFRERLDEVAKTSDQQVQALLPSVRETFAAYQQSVATTLAAVDAASSTKTSETAQKLLEVVMRSDAVAESLRSRMNAVAERMTRRAEEFEQATADEYVSTSRTLIVISVISVIAGLALGMLIGQFGISKPIQSIVALLQALAAGDYDVAVHSTERKDEVGEVAKAALVFKENGLAKTRMELERKETERRATAQRRADMLQLADRFEGAIGEIVDTVSSASTELEASATTLTSTAERGQTLATTVASASEEASTNVQSVASATEELSSSVNEISRQVQESARMASEAVEQARMTNDRVGELSKAAGRIGDVVELINTIAGQTNLLALNATIEAARAGEAGRGFAVVASEVKALAEQTAKATGEIGQQIASIQTATNESVSAIRDISGTIERLSEISSTIAAAVEEQGAATQEISRNVQQAAQGTQQVSANITDVQRGASETGSASSQVLSAAQSLSSDSNRLKLEVGKFLNSVRAA